MNNKVWPILLFFCSLNYHLDSVSGNCHSNEPSPERVEDMYAMQRRLNDGSTQTQMHEQPSVEAQREERRRIKREDKAYFRQVKHRKPFEIRMKNVASIDR